MEKSVAENGAGKRAAWVALALLTALNLFNYIDRYILPGVQPLVQREFHVSDERMGALTYAFFLTYMLAAPLTGWRRSFSTQAAHRAGRAAVERGDPADRHGA